MTIRVMIELVMLLLIMTVTGIGPRRHCSDHCIVMTDLAMTTLVTPVLIMEPVTITSSGMPLLIVYLLMLAPLVATQLFITFVIIIWAGLVWSRMYRSFQ